MIIVRNCQDLNNGWNQKFTKNVDIMRLTKHVHPSWKPMFEAMEEDEELIPVIHKINNVLTLCKNNKNDVIPNPKFVFNTFILTPLTDLKVVFIGIEPSLVYASGLAFSQTYGQPRPTSVNNIIKNLEMYGHISSSTDSSNLSKLTEQKCMLLDLSLTSIPNAHMIHESMWKKFTDKIMSYISNNCDHIVFVLWGTAAIAKTILIDESKHYVVTASHPSGLSCNKSISTSTISAPAFNT
jgi:uracil-DNA glycosylase